MGAAAIRTKPLSWHCVNRQYWAVPFGPAVQLWHLRPLLLQCILTEKVCLPDAADSQLVQSVSRRGKQAVKSTKQKGRATFGRVLGELVRSSLLRLLAQSRSQ